MKTMREMMDIVEGDGMKPYDQVFELIKNGEWTVQDFAKWLGEVSQQSYDEGQSEGYDDGYEQCHRDMT